jgi:hypothetical protein
VASTSEKRIGYPALAKSAAQIDHKIRANFRFQNMVRRLAR